MAELTKDRAEELAELLATASGAVFKQMFEELDPDSKPNPTEFAKALDCRVREAMRTALVEKATQDEVLELLIQTLAHHGIERMLKVVHDKVKNMKSVFEWN